MRSLASSGVSRLPIACVRASSGNSTRSLKLGSSSTFISVRRGGQRLQHRDGPVDAGTLLGEAAHGGEHQEQGDEDEAEAHRKDRVHHTSTFETLDIQRMPTASSTAMPTHISQPIGVVNIGST